MMTGWNALPPEIHHHILRLFCQDVIDKYTRGGSKPHHYERWTPVTEPRFPAAPSCLRHISSAIRVCRFFHHTIVHDIKIHSVPAMKHLQILQLSKVRDIADHFKSHPSCWNRNPVHVGAFVKLAGVFWKNSLILDDPKDIFGVLEVLQKSSFMMLLPHLNEWVHRHAILQEEDNNMDFYACLMKEWQYLDVVQVTFGFDAKGSRFLHGGSYKPRIFTIAGLYRGIDKQTQDLWDEDEYGASLHSDEKLLEFQATENHECRSAFPILQLVDDAKPETWWVFQWIYADGWEWLLINFEEQIFWHRLMGNVVCLWNSGDGMWDPEEWALAEAVDRQDQPTKTILEVLQRREFA
jgi:hypothetical protein